MIAIELFEEAITTSRTPNSPPRSWLAPAKRPDSSLLRPVLQRAAHPCTLTIEDAQIRQGLEIISQCFERRSSSAAPMPEATLRVLSGHGDPGRIRRLRRIRQSVREQKKSMLAG